MFTIQFNEDTFDIFVNGNALVADIPNSHAYCVEDILRYTQNEFFVDFDKEFTDPNFGKLQTWIKLFRKNLSNSSSILSDY